MMPRGCQLKSREGMAGATEAHLAPVDKVLWHQRPYVAAQRRLGLWTMLASLYAAGTQKPATDAESCRRCSLLKEATPSPLISNLSHARRVGNTDTYPGGEHKPVLGCQHAHYHHARVKPGNDGNSRHYQTHHSAGDDAARQVAAITRDWSSGLRRHIVSQTCKAQPCQFSFWSESR